MVSTHQPVTVGIISSLKEEAMNVSIQKCLHAQLIIHLQPVLFFLIDQGNKAYIPHTFFFDCLLVRHKLIFRLDLYYLYYCIFMTMKQENVIAFIGKPFQEVLNFRNGTFVSVWYVKDLLIELLCWFSKLQKDISRSVSLR